MMKTSCCLGSFLVIFMMAGCTARTSEQLITGPARMLAIIGSPPVIDERARFREIFCQMFAVSHEQQDRPRCHGYLWRLTGEKAVAAVLAQLPQHDPRLHIVIVPGAFSECFSEAAQPYRSGVQQLQSLGYRIDTVSISGRSGSETNARLIADALSQIPVETDTRLLLLGYSKGAVDILHFLATYPQQAARVIAVLSVASPVYGSPLADMTATLYSLFGAYLLLPRCGPGDHLVLADLRPMARLQWLAAHPLPAHVQYFSLVVIAERARVARALSFPSRLLARVDLQNDGQILARDAIIPGSTLLGYVRADHWEVALTIEEELPFLAGRPEEQDTFHRDTLFEAMILFVIERLNNPVSGQ